MADQNNTWGDAIRGLWPSPEEQAKAVWNNYSNAERRRILESEAVTTPGTGGFNLWNFLGDPVPEWKHIPSLDPRFKGSSGFVASPSWYGTEDTSAYVDQYGQRLAAGQVRARDYANSLLPEPYVSPLDPWFREGQTMDPERDPDGASYATPEQLGDLTYGVGGEQPMLVDGAGQSVLSDIDYANLGDRIAGQTLASGGTTGWLEPEPEPTFWERLKGFDWKSLAEGLGRAASPIGAGLMQLGHDPVIQAQGKELQEQLLLAEQAEAKRKQDAEEFAVLTEQKDREHALDLDKYLTDTVLAQMELQNDLVESGQVDAVDIRGYNSATSPAKAMGYLAGYSQGARSQLIQAKKKVVVGELTVAFDKRFDALRKAMEQVEAGDEAGYRMSFARAGVSDVVANQIEKDDVGVLHKVLEYMESERRGYLLAWETTNTSNGETQERFKRRISSMLANPLGGTRNYQAELHAALAATE